MAVMAEVVRIDTADFAIRQLEKTGILTPTEILRGRPGGVSQIGVIDTEAVGIDQMELLAIP